MWYLHVWVWQGSSPLSWHAASLLSLRLLARDARNHLLQQMHTLQAHINSLVTADPV